MSSILYLVSTLRLTPDISSVVYAIMHNIHLFFGCTCIWEYSATHKGNNVFIRLMINKLGYKAYWFVNAIMQDCNIALDIVNRKFVTQMIFIIYLHFVTRWGEIIDCSM